MDGCAGQSNTVSLPRAFQTAQALFREIDDSPLATNSDEYQNLVRSCIEQYQLCRRMVDQLSLFSVDEIIDDVSTFNLRYMLIDAYLGQVILKLMQQDRKPLLVQAQICFERFYELCSDYGLVEKPDQQYYLAIKNQIQSNPTRSREEKIARYKRHKQLKSQAKELEDAISSRGPSNGRGNGDNDDDDDDDMDDTQRDHCLLLIQIAIYNTMEGLRSIQDERVLLEMQEKLLAGQGQVAPADVDNRLDIHAGRSQLQQATGPLLANNGKIMRPFTITSKRQDIQDGVFRPSWRLPTMTVDEYLDIEMERGNIISGGGKEPEKKDTEHDGDEEAQDRETLKQREWDEFRDNNPRGWGNRAGKG
ncbi:TAP42-like protein [Dimargaris cristalligena]|uniref:TAP42-like protein n=1 Tax=Dimargaris cristalligena TaxID=215637 RepID=A0A4Q0A0J7_9FUNG|nr:TAP42-like protein [Dimargaris cristalligena]|eukprot:RKP39514.1 TAP42-like protein [Dimargaris cristalligena]